MPFSENSPRAGIKCKRLEANPEDDISNAVQALHGVVVVEMNASSANTSTCRWDILVCMNTRVLVCN